MPHPPPPTVRPSMIAHAQNPSPFCVRGVHPAPWVGPNDELVFIVVTSQQRLCGDPVVVPTGADPLDVLDALWLRLECEDPVDATVARRILRLA